jgi:hypothetical protein
VRGGIGDIHRNHEHGDATSRQCCLASRDGLASSLLGREDHLAEDTAALVDLGQVDLLDRFEAQILPHDLACDQDDGRAVAVGLVKSVDEVEAAGTAGACAGCKAAGKLSFRARREGPGLLVPHMDPIDFAAIDRMGDLVQCVADDAVAVLHAGGLQGFDYQIGYPLTHEITSWLELESV